MQLSNGITLNQTPTLQSTWFTLTADCFSDHGMINPELLNSFQKFSVPPVIPPTPPEVFREVVLPTPPKTFRSSFKINLTDYYPELKEQDKHWRTYNRLLKATAAAHDTLQILDHMPISLLLQLKNMKHSPRSNTSCTMASPKLSTQVNVNHVCCRHESTCDADGILHT